MSSDVFSARDFLIIYRIFHVSLLRKTDHFIMLTYLLDVCREILKMSLVVTFDLGNKTKLKYIA